MTEVSTPFSDPGEMSADTRARLDEVFRAGGIGDLLGIRLLDWGPGWSRLQLEPSPEIANIPGSVHGGALYTLPDPAFEAGGRRRGAANGPPALWVAKLQGRAPPSPAARPASRTRRARRPSGR